MVEIKRIVKVGFVNFVRSGHCFLGCGVGGYHYSFCYYVLLLLQAVLHSSLDQIKNKVDVTIYFTVGADEDKILALKNHF